MSAQRKKAPAWINGSDWPAWVYEAFAASLPLVNERLRPGGMRQNKQRVDGACLCCGASSVLLVEHSGNGLAARYEHWQQTGLLFQRFAATCPTPSEYAEIFRGVLVPTFNMMFASRRRCLECGAVFELRSPEDSAVARYCSGECSSVTTGGR